MRRAAQLGRETVCAVAWFVAAAVASAGQQIPTHPRDLTFKPLDFEVPVPGRHKRVLSSGLVAYMVEDHELPLVTVSVLIRAGSYLDPKGKEGLAGTVGRQMRSGGAGDLNSDAFDEAADFLAANLSSGLGGTYGFASANFLAKDTDKALGLFFDMLRSPRFQEDRLALYKAQVIQSMERRNYSTDSIEAREWTRLMRGDNHFTTAAPTKASIETITRDDLLAFHHQQVQPANFIFAVSGDFSSVDIQARLEKALERWPAATGTKAPPVPKPTHVPVPGVYAVDKPDVNQGRVTMGHLGLMRGHPDEVAISLMNDVLGGSGFTSRITNRVRSDEGLAYSAGSDFDFGDDFEGTFTVGFQSKSASVARAVQIVLDEIERIRTKPISSEELTTVQSYAIEVFPRMFSNAAAVATIFAMDDLVGRDHEFWRTYRSRVRAVTVDEVLRVAKEHLRPEALVILVVGNVAEMVAGDPDNP